MTPEISVIQMRKYWEGGLGVLGYNDARPERRRLDCASAPVCQFLCEPECSLSELDIRGKNNTFTLYKI